MPCRSVLPAMSDRKSLIPRGTRDGAQRENTERGSASQTNEDLSCAPTPQKCIANDDCHMEERVMEERRACHEEWPICRCCSQPFSVQGENVPKTLPCQHIACWSCVRNPNFVQCTECAAATHESASLAGDCYKKVLTTNTLLVEWMKILQDTAQVEKPKARGAMVRAGHHREDGSTLMTTVTSKRQLEVDPFDLVVVDDDRKSLEACLSIRTSKRRTSLHANYNGSIYFDEISTLAGHDCKISSSIMKEVLQIQFLKDTSASFASKVNALPPNLLADMPFFYQNEHHPDPQESYSSPSSSTPKSMPANLTSPYRKPLHWNPLKRFENRGTIVELGRGTNLRFMRGLRIRPSPRR
eukprot:765791-Hanusia_phi.AAC.7